MAFHAAVPWRCRPAHSLANPFPTYAAATTQLTILPARRPVRLTTLSQAFLCARTVSVHLSVDEHRSLGLLCDVGGLVHSDRVRVCLALLPRLGSRVLCRTCAPEGWIASRASHTLPHKHARACVAAFGTLRLSPDCLCGAPNSGSCADRYAENQIAFSKRQQQMWSQACS